MSARSLYDAFRERSALFLDRPAVSSPTGALTFAELRDRAEAVAAWLINVGKVQTGQVVAVLSEESLYWTAASLGIQGAGAVELPRETTIGAGDFVALQRDFGFRVAVFQNPEVAGRFEAGGLEARLLLEGMRPGYVNVRDLVAATDRDRTELGRRNLEPLADATASYIRTSGTTGEPKIVPLTHRSLIHMMETLSRRALLTRTDRVLSVLPPWHLYARVVQCAAFHAGAEVYYGSPYELESLPGRVRPTLLPGFPEIWEAVYHKVIATFTAHGALGRPFFWLLGVSILYYRGLDAILRRERSLRRRPLWRDALHRTLVSVAVLFWPLVRLADALIFRRVRAALGGRLRAAIIGDAPLPLPIDEALRALGFVVLEGYGSTEQCVTVMRSPRRNVTGTAGRALPGTRILFLDEEHRPVPTGRIGQIAVHGPQVFAGYYGSPTQHNSTDQLFVSIDNRRYLLTGDLGCRDFHDNIVVVGRREHAFPLGDERLVYPELVEGVLRASRFAERIVVIGRGLRGPVALVVPDLTELYRALRRGPSRPLEPAREARLPIHAILKRAAASRLVESEFRRRPPEDLPWEYIGPERVVLLSKPFVPQEEITPTLKPRRHVIGQRYADLAQSALDQDNFVSDEFGLRKNNRHT